MRTIKRHTQEEMFGHIETWKRSSQSQKDYCDQAGLAYTTYIKRKERGRSNGGSAVGYNDQDFGNFLWGMGGQRLGFGLATLKTAAHGNNAFNGKSDNQHIPDYEHKILDSSKDQRAIRNGFYFNRKPQRGGVTAPIIGF